MVIKVKFIIYGFLVSMCLITAQVQVSLQRTSNSNRNNCSPENQQVKKEFRLGFLYRLLAEKGPAPPPLGNFADIVYLKEQSFLIQMRDVCTLYAGA